MKKTYWRSKDNEGIVIVCENPPFLWEEISEEEFKKIRESEYAALSSKFKLNVDEQIEKVMARISRPRGGMKLPLNFPEE